MDDREVYQQEGFIVKRGFLSAAELEECHKNVDRFLETVVPGLPGDQVPAHKLALIVHTSTVHKPRSVY